MTTPRLPDPPGDDLCPHDGGTHYDEGWTAGLCNLCGAVVFGCSPLDDECTYPDAAWVASLTDAERDALWAAMRERGQR